MGEMACVLVGDAHRKRVPLRPGIELCEQLVDVNNPNGKLRLLQV
jgi:hypothetical protein